MYCEELYGSNISAKRDSAYMDQECFRYYQELAWEAEQAWQSDMEERILADEQYDMLFGHQDEKTEQYL